jgi:Phytanoyl-CoA dioxygenase (PhyH)
MSWEFDSRSSSEHDVRDALRIFGFVVIRNVLDLQEVGGVRAELDKAFASAHLQDLPTLCSTEVLKREPIWRMLFKDRVVSSLRAALGPELYYQHDVDVQRNSYGLLGWSRHSGWHMDAGSETGNAYLKSADYRFVKCGIFLQDSDNGWGGGIRIKPKSHRSLFEANRLKRSFFFFRRALSRITAMLRLDVDTFEVPIKAGDLCFFDSRLLHSSVPPSWENIKKIGYDRNPKIRGFWQDIPKECTKYVIYWDACDAAMVDDFLRNSIKRSESEPTGMSEHRFRPAVFTRILSVKYPEDFPAEFAAAATRSRVGVASLDIDRAAFYRRKLQTMQLLHP